MSMNMDLSGIEGWTTSTLLLNHTLCLKREHRLIGVA